MTKQGFNIVEIVDGGSAEKGQEVFFTLKLHNGQQINLFWPYETFTVLITALMTFAGMTKKERVKLNPKEGQIGNVEGASAVRVSRITAGTSADGVTTIVQFHSPQGACLNVGLSPTMLKQAAKILDELLVEAGGTQSPLTPKTH